MSTKIEWCDETINPLQDKIKGKSSRGYHCTKISPGCLRCYAEGINNRFGNRLPFDGRKAEFELIQSELEKPLHWKKPRRIFVQSMGDLFHERINNRMIDRVFGAIAYDENYPLAGFFDNPTPHTYLILTKRPGRILAGHPEHFARWPNIWLGVTVCNQEEADEKIPILLQIPAAVRFISFEPLLSRVNAAQYAAKLDWAIIGCESGLKRRHTDIEWIEDLKDTFVIYNKPVFIKQAEINGKVVKVPKIDGKEWDQYPEIL